MNDYEKFFSSKDIIKATIRHVLLYNNRLTAKQIQQKVGLKRQTTYNYLSELVKEGILDIEYERIENRPNLNIAYYSIHKKNETSSELGDITFTEKVSNIYLSPEKGITKINKSLNMSIAALLETKAAINRMTPKELESYLNISSGRTAFLNNFFLLTDKEFDELEKEFKELLNRHWKKWKKKGWGTHTGNTFVFGLFKKIPKK